MNAMTSTAFFRKLREYGRALRRDRDGNVILTFALALIPLIGLVGAAIDYSRAASIRTAMQTVSDATALAISKSASSLSAADLQTAANKYFKALFTRTDAQSLAIKATYIDGQTGGGSSSVTVTANAVMNTSFMGIMGYSQIPLTASSMTKWGNVRLRVALVLDNTGSMSESGKMTALKTASKNLLDQ
jgi:Flp pilus assembly protein TadG